MASKYSDDVGVNALNALIRQLVNPASDALTSIKASGQIWRQGDRVICNRTIKWSNNTTKVTNGEVGFISKIDLEQKLVYVTYSDNTTIPHSKTEMSNMSLAYALTIHKSEGSEFDGVVLVMPKSHQFMLSRNLLYTGMTRGKKDVILVGDPQSVRAAILRPGSDRLTGLCVEIQTKFATKQQSISINDRPPIQVSSDPAAPKHRLRP